MRFTKSRAAVEHDVTPGTLDFSHEKRLVASGGKDGLVKLWDLAPLDILVREAGGTFTDIEGTPGPHGGSAVASNGLLHSLTLAYLTAE